MANSFTSDIYNYFATHNSKKNNLPLYQGSEEDFFRNMQDEKFRATIYNYLVTHKNEANGEPLYQGTMGEFNQSANNQSGFMMPIEDMAGKNRTYHPHLAGPKPNKAEQAAPVVQVPSVNENGTKVAMPQVGASLDFEYNFAKNMRDDMALRKDPASKIVDNILAQTYDAIGFNPHNVPKPKEPVDMTDEELYKYLSEIKPKKEEIDAYNRNVDKEKRAYEASRTRVGGAAGLGGMMSTHKEKQHVPEFNYKNNPYSDLYDIYDEEYTRRMEAKGAETLANSKAKVQDMRDRGVKDEIIGTDDDMYLDMAEKFNYDYEKLLKAPNKYSNTSGISNWWEGVKDAVWDADNLTLGIREGRRMYNMAGIAEKVSKNQPLSESESIALEAYGNYLALSLEKNERLAQGYNIGDITGESLPFLAEMLVTSGIGAAGEKLIVSSLMKAGKTTLAKNIAKAMGGVAFRQTLKNASGAVAKNTLEMGVANSVGGRIAQEVGKSLVQTAAMPSTYGAMMEDKANKLLAGDNYGFKDRLRSFIGSFNEVLTERVGGKLIEKPLQKIVPTHKIWGNRHGGANLTYGLVDGIFGETGEEYEGAILDIIRSYNPMFSEEENAELRNSAKAMFTGEGFMETAASMAPMSILFGGVNAAQIGHNMAKYKKAKNGIISYLQSQGATEKDAKDIVAAIELSDNDQDFAERSNLLINKMWDQFAKEHPEPTAEEIEEFGVTLDNAVGNYFKAAVQYSYTIRDLNDRYNNLSDGEKAAVKDKFDTGVAYIKRANAFAERERENLKQGTSAIAERHNMDKDGMWASYDRVVKDLEQGTSDATEEDNAIYQELKDLYQKVDKEREDFEAAEKMISSAEEDIDKRVNTSNSRLQEVKVGNEEEVSVVKSGNMKVVEGASGEPTIDKKASDDVVTITDAEGNNPRQVGIDTLTPVTDVSAAEAKAASAESIHREVDNARIYPIGSSVVSADGIVSDVVDTNADGVTILSADAEGNLNETFIPNDEMSQAYKPLDIRAGQQYGDFTINEIRDDGSVVVSATNGDVAELGSLADAVSLISSQVNLFDTEPTMPYQPSQDMGAEQASQEAPQVDQEPAAPKAKTQLEQDVEDAREFAAMGDNDYVASNLNAAKKRLEKANKKQPKATDKETRMQEIQAIQAERAAAQAEVERWTAAQGAIDAAEAEQQVQLDIIEGKSPETAALREDLEPKTANEYTALFLSRKDIKITPESYDRHIGGSASDRRGLVGKIATAKKGGKSIDELGDMLLIQAQEEGYGHMFDEDDPMAGVNSIIEVLSEVKSVKDLNNYIRDNRERQALELEEENRDRQESEARAKGFKDYAEQLAYEEAEAKKAEELANDNTAVPEKNAKLAEIERENLELANELLANLQKGTKHKLGIVEGSIVDGPGEFSARLTIDGQESDLYLSYIPSDYLNRPDFEGVRFYVKGGWDYTKQEKLIDGFNASRGKGKAIYQDDALSIYFRNIDDALDFQGYYNNFDNPPFRTTNDIGRALTANRAKLQVEIKGTPEYQALMEERAEIIRQYCNAISSSSIPIYVSTKETIAEDLRARGVSEDNINIVLNAMKRGRVNGFSLGGINIIVDEQTDIEDTRITYNHERQHVLNAAHPEIFENVLSIATISELLKYIEILSGSKEYTQSYKEGRLTEAGVADEFLAFAMENAYEVDDISEFLKQRGITNEQLINIIKSIDYAEQNTSDLSYSRRREGSNLSKNRVNTRQAGQDGGNSSERSRGNVGEQRFRIVGEGLQGIRNQARLKGETIAESAKRNAAIRKIRENSINQVDTELNAPAFRIREKEAPKKTFYAYKLFNVDEEGNPHALFIDSNNALSRQTWYDAESPEIKDLEKLEVNNTYLIDKEGNATLVEINNKNKKPTTRMIKSVPEGSRYIYVGTYKDGTRQYMNWGLNGNGNVAPFALRPGWHATDVPSARHIGKSVNNKVTYRKPNQRWFLIEVAADKDYNEEASKNKRHEINTHIPADGYYSFRTNTNANNVNQDWIIAGSIKIVRPLSEEDVHRIAREKGVPEDLPYENGIKNFSEEDTQTPPMFRITPEMQDIKDKAIADGTFMKAPNGNNTNLDERQWLQVRTKNFMNWFGDWINDPENASKVVDENGEPKVVKHGTPEYFNRFDKNKIGSSTDYGWLGRGFYFYGNNADYASQYASNDTNKKGRVIDAFLNIRDPYYASYDEMSFEGSEETSKEFTDNIINEGYDGVFYNADLNEEWMALNPNQIKSATDNNGDFSNDNDDIRFRVSNDADGQAQNQLMETNKMGSLVGLHNLGQNNLRHALKLGGIANPSTAVIDIDRQDFEDFGDISLIMPSQMVDKKLGRNQGTYTGDAWTPTYPQITTLITDKGEKEYRKKIREIIPNRELSTFIESKMNQYLQNGSASELEYLFLKSKGIDVDSTYKSKYNKDVVDKFSEIVKDADTRDMNNLSKEQLRAITKLYADMSIKNMEDRLGSKLTAKEIKFLRDKVSNEEGILSSMAYYDLESGIRKEKNNLGKIDVWETSKKARDYVRDNGMNDEYQQWLSDFVEDGWVDNKIFMGFTSSGNRRYMPYTLENISKAMNKESKVNAYSNKGFDATRSLFLKKLNSLSQIIKYKDMLETSDNALAKVDSLKEDMKDIISQLYEQKESNRDDLFGYDITASRLQEAFQSKRPKRYLESEYGYTIDEYLSKQIRNFIKEVQNTPVKYFETKFNRPVYLNEFKSAVIPSNMADDLKGALADAGLDLHEYDADKEGDRRRATLEASNNDEVRFRFIGEQGAANMDKAEEVTTRLDNLKVARKMEKAKKDDKTIKLATGWERGVDNKWRYETPDFKTLYIDGNPEWSVDNPEIQKLLYLKGKINGIKERLSNSGVEDIDMEYEEVERDIEDFYNEMQDKYGEEYLYEMDSDEMDKEDGLLRRRENLEMLEEYQRRLDDYNDLREKYNGLLEAQKQDSPDGLKLSDFIDDKDLFKAYPSLKNVGVVFEDLPMNIGGTYYKYRNVIALNKKIYNSAKNFFDSNVDILKTILPHEIQHVIQHIEGFASGGNSQTIRDRLKDIADRVGIDKEAYNELHDKLVKLYFMKYKLKAARKWFKNPKSFLKSSEHYEYWDDFTKHGQEKAYDYYWDVMNDINNGYLWWDFGYDRQEEFDLKNDYEALGEIDPYDIAKSGYHTDEAIKAIEKVEKEVKKELRSEVDKGNIKLYDKLMDKLDKETDMQLYLDVAGEVESRNVEKRRNMSYEERLNSLAKETEDVAREDQLVLLGNSIQSPRFRMTPEMKDIKDRAVADKTFMKAPNGKDSNLNETQWLQSRTKAFLNWFGDWINNPKNSSKVLDENGEPMVIYHTTPSESIDRMRPLYEGMPSVEHNYFYFAESRDWSRRFAKDYFDTDTNTFRFFMSAKNPLDLRNETHNGKEWIKVLESKGIEIPEAYIDRLSRADHEFPTWVLLRNDSKAVGDLRQAIMAAGYDSVVLSDAAYGNVPNDTFVALKPSQVKLADGSNTTYDPNEDRVKFRITAEQDAEYMDAVKRGDIKKAQEMVDAAAKDAGYTDKVYHGTSRLGFTKFLKKFSEDLLSLFFTDSDVMASSYTRSYGADKVRLSDEDITKAAKLFLNDNTINYRNLVYSSAEGLVKDFYSRVTDNQGRPIKGEVITYAEQIDYLKELLNHFAPKIRKEIIGAKDIAKIDELLTWIENADSNTYFFDINEKKNELRDRLASAIKGKGSASYTKQLIDAISPALTLRNSDQILESTQYDKDVDGFVIRNFMDPSKIVANIEIGAYKSKENGEYITAKELKRAGVYELFLNPENILVIDAEGATWNDIKVPSELQDELGETAKTRDIAKYANEHGYNGVKFLNLIDYGGIPSLESEKDFEPSTVYAMFNNSDIKSADPITYDDNGNVIPLSERFNDKEEDIRFRMTDEEESRMRIVADPAKLYDMPQWKIDETFADYAQKYQEWREAKIRYKEATGAEIPNFPKWDKSRMTLKEYAEKLKEFNQGKEVAESVSEFNKEVERQQNILRAYMTYMHDTNYALKKFYDFFERKGAKIDGDSNAYNDVFLRNRRAQNQIEEYTNGPEKKMMKAISAILRSKRLNDLEMVWSDIDAPTTKKKHKKNGKRLTPREIIDVYVQAKDILEGAEMNLPDRGAQGMINNLGLKAETVVELVEGKLTEEQIKNLWEGINGCTQYSLDLMLKSGLIDKYTYDEFAKRKFYVPERGWKTRDLDDREFGYINERNKSGYSSYNPALVKAQGRTSLASSPFAFIRSIAHSTIMNSEKNKTKQAFLKFCQENAKLGREYGAFHIRKMYMVNQKDKDGKTVYDLDGLPIRILQEGSATREMIEHDKEMQHDIETVRSLIKDLEKDKKKAKTAEEKEAIENDISEWEDKIKEIENEKYNAGSVTDSDLKYKSNNEKTQHVVLVKKGGQDYIIEVEDERVANAVNGKFESDIQGYRNVISKTKLDKITRGLASLKTQFSYVFAITNLFRDLPFSVIMNTLDHGAGFAAQAVGETLYSIGLVSNYLLHGGNFDHMARGMKHLGFNYSEQNMQYLREFIESGAQTGFSFTKPVEQLSKDFEKELKQLAKIEKLSNENEKLAAVIKVFMSPGNSASNLFGFLSELSEMIVRFGQFKTARKRGASIKDAAIDAKEVTTNFDRHGKIAGVLGPIYYFFNAALQGTTKLINLAVKNPKRTLPLLGGWAMIYTAVGFLNTILNPDDPDDEVYFSDYDRYTNLVINDWRIRLPHFFRMFSALGVNIALASQGRKSTDKAIYDTIEFMLGDLLPAPMSAITPMLIQYDNELKDMSILSPTSRDFDAALREATFSAFQPIVDIFVNQDFKGSKVLREPFMASDEGKVANSQLYKRNVDPMYVSISNWLKKVTGGDPSLKYKGEGIDINPSALQYLVKAYGGGSPQLMFDTFRAIYMMTTGHGEELTPAQTPIVRDFTRPYLEERAYTQEYWSLKGNIDWFETTMKDKKKNNQQAYKELLESEEYKIYKEAKKIFKDKEKPDREKDIEFSASDVAELMRGNAMFNKNEFIESEKK